MLRTVREKYEKASASRLPLTASYPAVFYLALAETLADRQTFQIFTGAAPGGSSTSAIHGSRKTWKV